MEARRPCAGLNDVQNGGGSNDPRKLRFCNPPVRVLTVSDTYHRSFFGCRSPRPDCGRTEESMRLPRYAVALAVLVVMQAHAQSDKVSPDPGDPRASIPSVQYRSMFEKYRPLGNDKVGDWKTANYTVRRIGGWKVYAQESHEAEAAPSTERAVGKPTAPTTIPSKPATPAKPSAHGHH